MSSISITLIGVGIALVMMYWLYARLITRRNQALEALSGIDVQIRKRANLIPNVLGIAKRFLEHERSLLDDVTKARTQFDKPYNQADAAAVQEHLKAADDVQNRLTRLFAVAEGYPELTSNSVMVEVQEAYQEVEAKISAARRFYNSAVTDLNNAVQIFPSFVIANVINISAMPYFELDDTTSKVPPSASDHL